MSLKTKANIVGTLAIICGLVAAYFALFRMPFVYEGIIFLSSAFFYVALRDIYKEIRTKEIDEEYKKWRYDNSK